MLQENKSLTEIKLNENFLSSINNEDEDNLQYESIQNLLSTNKQNIPKVVNFLLSQYKEERNFDSSEYKTYLGLYEKMNKTILKNAIYKNTGENLNNDIDPDTLFIYFDRYIKANFFRINNIYDETHFSKLPNEILQIISSGLNLNDIKIDNIPPAKKIVSNDSVFDTHLKPFASPTIMGSINHFLDVGNTDTSATHDLYEAIELLS
jgi:hypothetical protein